MGRWKSLVTTVGGRPAILSLGGLYLIFAIWVFNAEVAGGTPVPNAILLALFVGGPGVILLVGGYWLSRTNIHSKFSPTVTGWCLSAIALLSGLLALYHLSPYASIDNPVQTILIISGFVVVPALVGGLSSAKSKTRAFELDERNQELQEAHAELQERKTELQHVRERMEFALTNTDAVVWEWDVEQDRASFYSSEEPLFGTTIENWEDFVSVIHPEDRDAVQHAIETSLATGEPKQEEVRIIRDGQVRWIEAPGQPVTDADGSTKMIGVARDITNRRQREGQLEQQALQQRVVAELGQLALESDDLDELMHEVVRQVADVLDNDYCKVLELDHDAEELLLRQGVGWREGIVGKATVSSIEDRSQAAVTLANEEPIVVQDLATDGRIEGPDLLTNHDVTSGISTIIGSIDEPWGILGTHDTDQQEFTPEDVNFVKSVANVLAEAIERERYQNELEQLVADLEESNERLEQFAYAASHDLQEPLRMVTSYLKLIEKRYDEELDEDGREFIEFAVDGAERMRDMIDALLEYSRVETQGDPFEPVALETVLEETLENLQLRIDETNADVTIESLPQVRGDGDQLRQVFQNLLSNAIEYSGNEPPQVHISAERAGPQWRIAVRDEGIGIDPEHTDRIFEVFKRLHSRDEHAGTGIGLALCQRIIERHGGEIWVESDPGEGATFSFTLPAGSEHGL